MDLTPRNPLITVDALIEIDGGIILIRRKNPPPGWAIPGGFVDYGESLEEAVVREMKEETCLDITLVRQFHTYSAPGRDPRHHTVSTIFIATATGSPEAADDAADIGIERNQGQCDREGAEDLLEWHERLDSSRLMRRTHAGEPACCHDGSMVAAIIGGQAVERANKDVPGGQAEGTSRPA